MSDDVSRNCFHSPGERITCEERRLLNGDADNVGGERERERERESGIAAEKSALKHRAPGLSENIVSPGVELSRGAARCIRDTPSLMTESSFLRAFSFCFSPSPSPPPREREKKRERERERDEGRSSENLRRCPRAPNYSALCPFPSIRIVKKKGIPPTLPGRSGRARGTRTRETAVADGNGEGGRCRNGTKKKWKSCNLHGLSNTRPSTSSPARERRQTAIKIRSLFSGSVRGYYVLGPPSRFFDRFVESGFEFRSGLRNPRVGTHAWARNAIVFGPDGHFKTNTCPSGTRKSPRDLP